jgi:hypothetical protein
MRRVRGKLTYANVMATVAVFLALGGGAYAASINGKTIKAKSLPGNRVTPGSLPGNRLKANSVTGTQVNESTLAQVPSAKNAENASALDGHTAGCPVGTLPFGGSCWETTARSAATEPIAAQTCIEAGGQLPDALSLRAFALKSGVALAAGDEWSNSIDTVTGENEYTGVTVSPTGAVNLDNQIDPKEFRCELPLLR